jgi:hypothetical protein
LLSLPKPKARALISRARKTVDQWERDHGQGWGVMAQRLGIKPGSAEFHRLKKGFVPTYDRWARPIDIDADLRKDFPNRGKGQKGGNGAPGKAKVHAAPVPAKANGADLGKSHGGAGAASGENQGSSGAKDKAPGKGKGNG